MLPIVDPNESLASNETGADSESFRRQVAACGDSLHRRELTQLQINLGKLCNQACTHCHVDAGPNKKRENMSGDTVDRLIELALQCDGLTSVDVTGGAPEMNPHFRRLVSSMRDNDLKVIDRCNLTIMSEPGYEWVADFLADHDIHVIASLPCYLEDNVDTQRGNGVFQRSLSGLAQLNQRGYRGPDSSRKLDLVFNPTSPSLPPNAAALEGDYRRELMSRYGIEFNQLLTITNIPIRRYASYLRKRGRLDEYMDLLRQSFNAATIDHLMCKHLVSISWDGKI
ncbi:MAG: arsenosugar biosynthesis radical SAM (seleno)protein ArsS, partial [Planctomycetota bacterium]